MPTSPLPTPLLFLLLLPSLVSAATTTSIKAATKTSSSKTTVTVTKKAKSKKAKPWNEMSKGEKIAVYVVCALVGVTVLGALFIIYVWPRIRKNKPEEPSEEINRSDSNPDLEKQPTDEKALAPPRYPPGETPSAATNNLNYAAPVDPLSTNSNYAPPAAYEPPTSYSAPTGPANEYPYYPGQSVEVSNGGAGGQPYSNVNDSGAVMMGAPVYGGGSGGGR